MKILIIVILSIIVIYLITYLAFGLYFYNYSIRAIFPKIREARIKKKIKDWNDDLTLSNKASKEWFSKTKKNEFYIESFDALKLHTYIIKNKSHNWVIIFHKYADSALGMLTSAHQFYNKGFNVLLPDQRAHGKSEGKYIGMGWFDRLDALEWIKYIIKEDEEAKIVLYGVSMGAATVMMTIGEALPTNVIGAIADSGYTSVYDEFSYQLKYFFKLAPRPILSAANIFAKMTKQYKLNDASCLKQIEKGKIPLLFVQGSKDKFVPTEMINILYNVYGGYKQKLIVENATHGKSSIVNPKLYWHVIDEFLNNANKG